MRAGWKSTTIDDVCFVEYGTRVVQKRDGGGNYPVYGGGGATFCMSISNRQNRVVISRFGMSEQCTRFVSGAFFLNDSGLTLSPKDPKAISQSYLDIFTLFLNDDIFAIGKGAAQKNLDVPFFKKLEIVYPTKLLEQQRIVAILDAAFESIATARANAEQNLQNARALFESHLQSVFTQQGEGWMEKTLGDPSIVQIVDGDRGANYPNKEEFSEKGYCLFLNTKNVRPDGFNFDSTMFISEEKDRALRKGKLKRGDVILTTRGTIGNIAVYDENVDFENVRINSGMLIFRPNSEKLLSSFLFEIFRSGIMKNQMVRYVSGAAQPQLPIRTLVNFVIPVPNTLNEQSQFVKNVRNIAEKTKYLEAIYLQKIAALDELKKALLHRAFSGQL